MDASPDLVVLSGAASLAPGQSVKFTYADGPGLAEGFAVVHETGVAVYANRCAHIALSLDWDDNRFFTADGRFLVCSTHGAVYRPDDGVCVAGPCAGDRLEALPFRVEGDDVVVLVPPVPPPGAGGPSQERA